MIHSSAGVKLGYAIGCTKGKIPIIFCDRLSRALLFLENPSAFLKSRFLSCSYARASILGSKVQGSKVQRFRG
jgi:hypothetical protein